jgi:multiple sugar transport system substrate-binding protein
MSVPDLVGGKGEGINSSRYATSSCGRKNRMPLVLCPRGHCYGARGIYSLALILLLFFLTGCGARQAQNVQGPVHLEVWSMWTGDEEQDFERVLAYYNRTHPGVVLENLGAVDDPKTVRSIIAGAPPDLCTLANPPYLGALAANHALQPLNASFAGSGLKPSAYTVGALGQCRYAGHLYAVPYLLDCIALLYNKDVFRSAGLDPNKPPRTLEEMLDDCRRITRHDAQGHLTRIGMAAPDAVTMMGLFGGGFLNPKTGQITADNARNVEAVTFYQRLMAAQGGYEQDQAFAQGFASGMGSYNPFFTGQVGMTFSGEWNPYWVYHYSPNTHYGVAALPYPADHPEQKGTVWLGSNPLCIPVGAKHPKEAWEFLAWTQSVAAQRMFSLSLHGIPNIRAELRDPALRTGAPWRPQFGRFMDLADSPRASYFPPMPVANLYLNQIATAVDEVCYGQRTPQAALASVRVRVQREMDTYRP